MLSHLADARVQAAHDLDPQRTLTAVLDFLALHTFSPGELWREILESFELSARHPEATEELARTLEAHRLSFADLRRTLRRLGHKGFRLLLLCDEFELAVESPRFDMSFFGALRSLASSEGVAFVTTSRLSLLERVSARTDRNGE